MPAQPASQHVRGLPREFDDVVAACLDPDPEARPASVMAVAAALPGGDPVAAAIAAGRAPSVEAVARAGSSGTLRARLAYSAAAAIGVLILGFALVSGRMSVLGQARLELSPDVLRQRAIEILQRVGVDPELGDEYVSLSLGPTAYPVKTGERPRAREFTPEGPDPLLLYLRRSPSEYLSRSPQVGRDDPPLEHPHEVRAAVDGRGLLRELLVVPPQIASPGDADAAPDWSVLLVAAGLDPDEVVSVQPRLTPRFAADHQHAWRGTQVATAMPVVVEAAAYRGRPVSFVVLPPWDRRLAPEETGPPANPGPTPLAIGLAIAILGVVVWLARRAILRGQADLRGALRVAFAITLLHAIDRSLAGHYSSVQQAFYRLFADGGGEALFYGVLTFVFYVLVEPQCRRFLPRAMIGWTRLVRGQWRDRLVARDVLLGLGAGMFLACVTLATRLTIQPLGPLHVGAQNAEALLGGRFAGATLAAGVWIAVFGVLQIFILFLLLRIVLRGPRRAAVALAILWGLFTLDGFTYTLDPREFAVAAAHALIVSVSLVFVISRLGLLAAVTMQVALNLCFIFPISSDLSTWYSGTGLLGLLCLAALLLFGLRCAQPSAASVEAG